LSLSFPNSVGSSKEKEISTSFNNVQELNRTNSGKTTLFQPNTKEASPSAPMAIKKEFPLIALPEFVGLAFWFQVRP
jgi:hypothetical protein